MMLRVDVRWLAVGETVRYARGADRHAIELDGYLNFDHVTAAPGREDPRLLLEAGINPVAAVHAPNAVRRPVIAIRSSPWKSGHETNPWRDEFDLDHGHVRYFGDHKPASIGLPGVTRGNRALLAAWLAHQGSAREERLTACPLVLFRARTVTNASGRQVPKGHVDFCGVGLIERLEHVVQRDPQSGRAFPNLALDICVLDLTDLGDCLDWRWIDDRRDPSLTDEQTLRHAPAAWRTWVDRGRIVLPRIRRRVLASRVLSNEDQMPEPGSAEESTLRQVYEFFHGRKHHFERLAASVASQILGREGLSYADGWLTRGGGDGGLDFVGRLNVGSTAANTPLVVLGQAKCVAPGTSNSPDQVARLVARLQRGWIGIYVTTGTFSRQAQVEIIDDRYPVVLVNGRVLAEEVRLMAYSNYRGSVSELLTAVAATYDSSITNRRPEEILSG
jgi:AspBHI-like restriction endonuclease/restriction endonuclease